jgi:uncharacterized protein (TIGR02145 family)
MKKLLLPLLGIILMISCNKENIFDKTINETAVPEAQFKSSKIDVCHHEGNNNWHTINISLNALPAHVAHGDIVPDADGDGFSKVNPCGVGSQDDCDDNNAAINPAATEICGNNIDDNCNGQIDENCIPSVTICNQVWMLKNLDVDKYRDGTPILHATTNAELIAANNAGTGAWSYYNNDPATGTIYGKLYNWYAVNDPKGLSPEGWHIPSDIEWTTLSDCLGGFTIAGGKMKEIGTIHWVSPNVDATNSSGFTGLPGGARFYDGQFNGIGIYTQWWSSTQYSPVGAWDFGLDARVGAFGKAGNFKGNGFSVRCLRD